MSISMFSAKALTIAGVLGLGVTMPAIADNHGSVDMEVEAMETEVDAVESEVESVESEVEAVEPEAEASELEVESVDSEVEAMEPETEASELEVESVEPEAEAVELENEAVEPELDTVESEVTEPVESEIEMTEPELEATEPEVEAIESDVEAIEPEAETTESDVEVVEPEAEAVEPEAEMPDPEAEMVEPEADATGFEADEWVAQATDEVEPVATIGEIVNAVPEFSTLAAAIEAAELGEALMGEGPLTVIAPTNDGFAALPEGVVDALLLPENQDLLTDVLTYHVIPGEVPFDDLETGMVEALNGDDLTFTIDNDMALVDELPIVGFDIPADNGLIHIIEDGVLVPDGVVEELESRLAEAEAEPVVEEEPAVEEPAPVVEEEPAPAEPTAPAEPVRGLW